VRGEGEEKKNGAAAADAAPGGPRYEAVSDDFDDGGAGTKTAVAAQLEVLYDVTQEYIFQPPPGASSSSSSSSSTTAGVDGNSDRGGSDSRSEANASDQSSSTAEGPMESMQRTIINVATIQGWLKGGPDDGQLRWKLALNRPPTEFPNIAEAY
jgi:hypothetical protein